MSAQIEQEIFQIETLPRLPLSDRHQLPDIPAVYFAVSPTDEVLYVGRAVALRTRWRTHHRLPQLLKFTGVQIAWFEYKAVTTSPTDRDIWLDNVEKNSIEQLDPPLNGPAASPFARTRDRITPLHVHNCPTCSFLGHVSGLDLYACVNHGTPLVVVRNATGVEWATGLVKEIGNIRLSIEAL